MNFGVEFGYVFVKVEYFQDIIVIDIILWVINIYGSDFFCEFDFNFMVLSSFVDGFDFILVIE